MWLWSRTRQLMNNRLALLAYWSVRQKPNSHFSSVISVKLSLVKFSYDSLATTNRTIAIHASSTDFSWYRSPQRQWALPGLSWQQALRLTLWSYCLQTTAWCLSIESTTFHFPACHTPYCKIMYYDSDFSQPCLSNGRAISMVVVRPSVCLSVTNVLWLSFRA